MEPDILASTGDSGTAREIPAGANTVQSEGPSKVEIPPDITQPRMVRLHSVAQVMILGACCDMTFEL